MGINPFTNQRQVLLGMHAQRRGDMDHRVWEMHQEKNTKQSTGFSCEHCPQRTVGISLHGLPDTESVDGRLPAHYGDHIPFYALLHGYSNQKPARKNNSRSILQPLYRA